VLESGGRIDGVVYFEHVDVTGSLTLLATLNTPGQVPLGVARDEL
jgi:hypothetical protein